MRKWIGRIWEGIEICVLSFIFVSILNKLLFKEVDWLERSLATCIPYIFTIPIMYYYIVDKKRKRWPLVGSTAICVFIGSIFLLGVCLSIDEYWLLTWRFTFFSTCAMTFSQVNKAREEKRNVKRINRKLDVDVVV